MNGVLDQLRTLIYETFVRLGCSQKALEDMLGLNVPINTNNMIVYLGQIEQRANELLNILHYVNLKVRSATRTIVRACGGGQTHRHTDARDHNTFRAVYDSREM